MIALSDTNKILQTVSELSIKPTMGLSQYEIIALCTIVENMKGLESLVSHWSVSVDMQSMGFTKLAVKLSLTNLQRNNMINATTETDRDGDQYSVYGPTPVGMEWLIANEEKLQLLQLKKSTTYSIEQHIDDDIPF